MSDAVERSDTPIMFLRCADDPAAMRPAWERLEAIVGLRGRKFYGIVIPGGEYHVATEIKDGDDPDSVGLEIGMLPGGRYLRTRLHGEPPAVYEQIGPATDALLAEATNRDDTRNTVEFYRRRGEIDVLVPVQSGG